MKKSIFHYFIILFRKIKSYCMYYRIDFHRVIYNEIKIFHSNIGNKY